ncbi:Nucleolar 27S pre-rRNA processing [Cordyceps militaris]|uniref:Nucleolar 27S pre-rRNA processing n=1 Tax=Cordyceps militaris TaxID=73501 RepID=A0A2H4SN06_CORMI|nr:Nucleolar 27S pre-rRNA processing [Cordyceps militaris]
MDADNLIKVVRGLDQTGPGKDGENLNILWSKLVASSDDSFHAAEESTLRWLLKSMNGNATAAEALRRHPLTWTMLDCVFTRIPLFSLAKSLADRKFVAVLQQTLKDVSTVTGDSTQHTTKKRKRSSSAQFGSDETKQPHGCLATAKALFTTLISLLNRLDDTTATTARDNIGAEHIKSLFCMSAADTAALLAPTFSLCQLLVDTESYDIEGAEEWIAVASSLWNLHMQGTDDTSEVATHLFSIPASILSSLENLSDKGASNAPTVLKSKWSADLQEFLQRNLILPSRTTFLNRQDFSAITRALEAAEAKAHLVVPSLYFLATEASDTNAEGERRKNTVEWMKRIFEEVEGVIRRNPERNTLIKLIIRQAIKNSTPVDVKNLREIARGYVLERQPTDWALLGGIVTCDPAVFQTSGDGSDLLISICDKISKSTAQEPQQPIAEVLGAVRQSFVIRRDLVAFLQLWFTELKKAEENEQAEQSPWFGEGPRNYKGEYLHDLIEKELSTSQLSEFVGWLESQPTQSSPKSLCIVCDAISEGLKRDTYIDVVGLRLFQMTWTVCSELSELPARWRVSSKTMRWASPDRKTVVWESLKDKVKQTLKKGGLDAEETFECFRFCYAAWDALATNAETVKEPAKLITSFSERLAKKLMSESAIQKITVLDRADSELNIFDAEIPASCYLDVFLAGGSRFNRLFAMASGGVPEPLKNATTSSELDIEDKRTLWRKVFSNDMNLNEAKLARALVDQVIGALEQSGNEKRWPSSDATLILQTLSRIPLDSFHRWQRERIITTLHTNCVKMIKSPEKTLLPSWKQVLSLTTKMMARATFYEGMTFDHLVQLADAVSVCISKTSAGEEETLEMIERFSQMASATLRQMAEQVDERSTKYFGDCSAYISTATATKFEHVSGLHYTLIRSLISVLAKSPNTQNNETLNKLVAESQGMLARAIMSVINPLITAKALPAQLSPVETLQLLAATDAAPLAAPLAQFYQGKEPAALQTIADSCSSKMTRGDVTAWKLQTLLRNELPTAFQLPAPRTFDVLAPLPRKLQSRLLCDLTNSITKSLRVQEKVAYLRDLVDALRAGCFTDGQTLAIQQVVHDIIASPDYTGKYDGYDLAAAYSEIVTVLSKAPAPGHVALCRTLHSLLERKPQAVSQWDVEATLSTICDLSAAQDGDQARVPYVWLCKLTDVIIKKHRLRLEGHYHLLLTVLQTLLDRLVTAEVGAEASASQETKAHAYARLITLVCEPTAGAVSRTQHQGALDSATDAAKRSAGRHMHLVLMQYVKLQLTENVPRPIREALEPAMNSIFDITPPEGRKILNDAMDASGRAILREMFKRYVKFGKWSGV